MGVRRTLLYRLRSTIAMSIEEALLQQRQHSRTVSQRYKPTATSTYWRCLRQTGVVYDQATSRSSSGCCLSEAFTILQRLLVVLARWLQRHPTSTLSWPSLAILDTSAIKDRSAVAKITKIAIERSGERRITANRQSSGPTRYARRRSSESCKEGPASARHYPRLKVICPTTFVGHVDVAHMG